MATLNITYQQFVPTPVSPRDSESELQVAVAMVLPEDCDFKGMTMTSLSASQVPYGTVALAWTLFAGPWAAATTVASGSFSGALDFMEPVSLFTSSVPLTAGIPLCLVVYDNAGGANALPPIVWEFDVEVTV